MSKLIADVTLPLGDVELEVVTGGLFNDDFAAGQRGCIPPFGSLDPRFPKWVGLPNPWIQRS